VVEITGRPIRLIPSRFPPIQAFDDVASPDDLEAVMALEGWTNDRLVADRLDRLPRDQWVYGRPNASVVMASFLHPADGGSRFNGPDLGAWYAGRDLKTAVAEVAHHVRRDLHNTGKTAGVFEYREYRMTLGGDYEDIRGQQATKPELYHPTDYSRSQPHGENLRANQQPGILYDSVRLRGGENIACLQPSLVLDVAQADHWRLTISVDQPPVARKQMA
tara:strand:+ start:4833 stop:5489 length:657 start_codon:yes stop_codon:yes gene_type:complete